MFGLRAFMWIATGIVAIALLTQPVSVQAQCLFFDDQGEPVDINPPWQTLSIDVDSTAVVRFTAPNDSAKRYSVRVRKAR